MPKTTEKERIKVTLSIKPEPVSPSQKTTWRKFWQKLVAEVKANE